MAQRRGSDILAAQQPRRGSEILLGQATRPDGTISTRDLPPTNAVQTFDDFHDLYDAIKRRGGTRGMYRHGELAELARAVSLEDRERAGVDADFELTLSDPGAIFREGGGRGESYLSAERRWNPWGTGGEVSTGRMVDELGRTSGRVFEEIFQPENWLNPLETLGKASVYLNQRAFLERARGFGDPDEATGSLPDIGPDGRVVRGEEPLLDVDGRVVQERPAQLVNRGQYERRVDDEMRLLAEQFHQTDDPVQLVDRARQVMALANRHAAAGFNPRTYAPFVEDAKYVLALQDHLPPAIEDLRGAGVRALTALPGSMAELGKDFATAVANPYDTVDALAAIPPGAVRAVARDARRYGEVLSPPAGAWPGGLGEYLGGAEEFRHADPEEMGDWERTARGFFGELQDRYGSAEDLAETFQTDPAGMASDLLPFAAPAAGGAIRAAGRVVRKAGDMLPSRVPAAVENLPVAGSLVAGAAPMARRAVQGAGKGVEALGGAVEGAGRAMEPAHALVGVVANPLIRGVSGAVGRRVRDATIRRMGELAGGVQEKSLWTAYEAGKEGGARREAVRGQLQESEPVIQLAREVHAGGQRIGERLSEQRRYARGALDEGAREVHGDDPLMRGEPVTPLPYNERIQETGAAARELDRMNMELQNDMADIMLDNVRTRPGSWPRLVEAVEEAVSEYKSNRIDPKILYKGEIDPTDPGSLQRQRNDPAEIILNRVEEKLGIESAQGMHDAWKAMNIWPEQYDELKESAEARARLQEDRTIRRIRRDAIGEEGNEVGQQRISDYAEMVRGRRQQFDDLRAYQQMAEEAIKREQPLDRRIWRAFRDSITGAPGRLRKWWRGDPDVDTYTQGVGGAAIRNRFKNPPDYEALQRIGGAEFDLERLRLAADEVLSAERLGGMMDRPGASPKASGMQRFGGQDPRQAISSLITRAMSRRPQQEGRIDPLRNTVAGADALLNQLRSLARDSNPRSGDGKVKWAVFHAVEKELLDNAPPEYKAFYEAEGEKIKQLEEAMAMLEPGAGRDPRRTIREVVKAYGSTDEAKAARHLREAAAGGGVMRRVVPERFRRRKPIDRSNPQQTLLSDYLASLDVPHLEERLAGFDLSSPMPLGVDPGALGVGGRLLNVVTGGALSPRGFGRGAMRMGDWNRKYAPVLRGLTWPIRPGTMGPWATTQSGEELRRQRLAALMAEFAQ